MEKDIQSLKEQRTRLKTKLSTVSRQLSTANTVNISQLHQNLTQVYTDFLEAHYTLCELISSDEKYTDLGVVSGLDLNSYLEQVQDTYDSAIRVSNDKQIQRYALDVDVVCERSLIISEKLSSGVFDSTLLKEAENTLDQCNSIFRELCVFDSPEHTLCAKLGQIIRDFDAKVLRAKQSKATSTGTALHAASGFSTVPSQSQYSPGNPSYSSAPNTFSSSVTTNTLVDSSVVYNDPNTQAFLHRYTPRLVEPQSNSQSNTQTTMVTNPQPIFSRAEPDLSVVSAYHDSVQDPRLSNSREFLPSRSSAPFEENHIRAPGSRFKKSAPPVFGGNRRDWAEFRAVWLRYGECEFPNDEERAWALKGCLKGRALECVQAIYATQPGAYTRIWQRLDSIYSDISLSVQSVYNDLKRLKAVKEDDLRGMVKFVNEVELSYSQLGEVSQLQSITMNHIDELCDLLPLSVCKEWSMIYGTLTLQEKLRPFSTFMQFLERQRSAASRLAERQDRGRMDKETRHHKTSAHLSHAFQNFQTPNVDHKKFTHQTVSLCLIHNKSGVTHKTEQCSKFKALSVTERISLLKQNNACFQCFGHHMRRHCKETEGCNKCHKNHHSMVCNTQTDIVTPDQTDDNQKASASGFHSKIGQREQTVYPIQEVSVEGLSRKGTVFFDGGSNATFITHRAANELKARRLNRVQLDLSVMGNRQMQHSTYLYEVVLLSTEGSRSPIQAYGMDQLVGEVELLDQQVIHKIFPEFSSRCKVASNRVDILLGNDFYGLHPKKEVAQYGEHLSVMEGVLGACIQGRLVSAGGKAYESAHVIEVRTQCHHVNSRSKLNHFEFGHETLSARNSKLENFILGEDMGTEVVPKCGGCRCSKCPLPGHTFSFKEEREIAMIRDNLQYDPDKLRWVTSYPWTSDPTALPDNYCAALATLKSTERKLHGDEEWAGIYAREIQDMVDREVARKLSDEERANWSGPVFYISHLAVVNPKSKSTPVRIVFNSSQKFEGVSLNSHLAKGPDSYMNNLLGILLRWREEKVVLISDIKKMYNSIFLEQTEQHCHRFLWRDLESREPDVYVILRVNMGDRPAAAISTEAIYKTAELFQGEFPLAADLLRRSTYVDDIVHSVKTEQQALKLSKNTEEVLRRGGFKTKGWSFNFRSVQTEDLMEKCRVLGVFWRPEEDEICYEASINFSDKKKGTYVESDIKPEAIPASIPLHLTRRAVLAQVMRIYDPLGILSPFTLQSKVLLRETWEIKLGWDDPLPEEMRRKWVDFFLAEVEISKLRFNRCLTPEGAIGLPILILLSDASEKAYGASAYIRWELADGSFWCRLIMAKSRIAPLRRLSTPQMELNGAVMSKRIRKVLETEMRIKFEEVYHLIDSETVLSMINKLSTRFKLYEGVRVGEIQAATNGDLTEWYWIAGKTNTADWLTRGKHPTEIAADSEWWRGPEFLYQPTERWDIRGPSECHTEEQRIALVTTSNESSSPLMDYQRFSTVAIAVWALVIVLTILRKKSFRGSKMNWETDGDSYTEAMSLIIKDIQKDVSEECSKRNRGQFSKLNPEQDDRGIWRVGHRLRRYNPMSSNGTSLPILLPKSHSFTTLLMRDTHVASGHRGRDVTLARFRQTYWVSQGSRLASKVIGQCQLCRLRDSKWLNPSMGLLPESRLKPGGAPFQATMVDLFGPYAVRGEVQKRTTGKAYGVIFTDLCSRAVHIEGVFGYDSASFLLAFRRFVCIRGWPRIIYSDPGSQLVGAEKELVAMWNAMDRVSVYKQSTENGTTWKFSPADSPWRQGAVEILVKAAKRCFRMSFGTQRLSPTEFLTVCAQATNILNERPIGMVEFNKTEVTVVTPNCLLIGRPHGANPGHSSLDGGVKKMLESVDEITQRFWNKWLELYPPTLMVQKKWRKSSVNLKAGDVVVVADSNSLRGQYRIALVKEVYPGCDGQVRQVALVYKNFKSSERVHEYKGAKGIIIYRSVRRLAPLVLVGEDEVGCT